MPYTFTVSPDFGPDQLANWHIFNTWLQRQLTTDIHFETFDSFEDQRQAIHEGKVDIIYANPYDASFLVREKGFVAVASPHHPDETTVAVSATSPVDSIESLKAGCRIAQTDDPDISMMGMILLEPADLHKENTETLVQDSYIQVAKALLQNQADVGFFLADAYEGLSNLVKSQLKPLVNSDIQIVSHALLLGPQLLDRKEELNSKLQSMSDEPQGKNLLESLGFQAWNPIDEEEMEFMIDLIEALAA
ncbi:phosphate/phosphite/phosphonate ABC transporter substrate-binding protein [Thiolapillus brandeum]|uniref:Phosphonate ABC transporter substrate-binding protein n=1 Tax=Thiolapillus brandeum TaxID=1076588 RepID=A0A7U6GL83_9GAMM|nr:phosphate/phosphite/phosphonate ABC transporter substrate-binding protein [Thiolapillus brandeum]BAO45718.1 phosphonate ABC transporter substrate-binding protein [Thiolapillus brandeum]